jgi:hypothetical protein
VTCTLLTKTGWYCAIRVTRKPPTARTWKVSRLQMRLGFQKVGHNDTHNLMAYDPQR